MTNATTWSESAERAVLAACMVEPGAYDRAELEPEELRHPAHQATWRAIGALRRRKEPIDPTTLEAELERSGKGAATGGLVWLSGLLSEGWSAANIEHYAAIVRRAALTRRIHREVTDALASGLDGEDLLGRVFEAVSAVGAPQTDGSVLMPDLIRQTFLHLSTLADRIGKGEDVRIGIPTGFADVDRALGGGLAPGVITVLGGRPSHGKSSLARAMADGASEAGHGVHFFSLEDERQPLAQRTIADRGRIDLGVLRSLKISRADRDGMERAAGELFTRRNWRIDDTAGLSSAQIAMRVRRHKGELKTALVVVDYLQLMREKGCRDRRAELERALGGLAELARKERVAILLLSQLNRENEKEKRPPSLVDLRETGEIEQIAASALLVHQYPEVVEEERADRRKVKRETGTMLAEVIVAKNKHGRRGFAIPLTWEPACASYRSQSRRETGEDWRESA